MVIFPARPTGSSSMLKFLALPTLAVIATVFLAGCQQKALDPNDPNFVVAEKGDFKVTKAQLDAAVDEFLKSRQATPAMVGQDKMPVIQTAMLRNIVLKQLLLDRAATLQLKDVDKEEAAELEKLKGPMSDADFQQQLSRAGMTLDQLKQKIHEKVVVMDVLQTEAFKNADPSDQEINAIYEQYKDSFNIPETIRVSRILVHMDDKATPAQKAEKKKAIDQAHTRVAKGEDFSKVAMEMSEDQTSKTRGGDLGAVRKGESEPGFDEVAFKTKVNALSPVFLTPLGYEFVKVTEHHDAGVVPIAEARSYIAQKLRERKMEEQEQAYAQKLLANSGVKYNIPLVEPPAQMMPPSAPGGAPAGGAPAGGSPAAQMPEASASTPPMGTPDVTTNNAAPAANAAPAK